MDYLSNLREVKSVIESAFRDHLCFQGSSMKYTKFGDDIESQENLNNDLIHNMLDGEKINCDLGSLQAITLYSDSSFESESSDISDKGSNSFQNSTDDFSRINDSVSEENKDDDLPIRLVVTYHFSFDVDEADINDDKNITEEEEMFENCSESSFSSDNDVDMLEYSSVKNGSKNNLLDCDFEQNLCTGEENIGLVDYESDAESSNSAPALSVESANFDQIELDTSDSEENGDKVSSFCGNPSMPCMRQGFIYYSSELRLYQGELRYNDTYPEKRFKLARKLFKKMFPSQKYVVNA